MKPDAPKSKEKHAPAAPDRVAGLSRRAQFMILFFVAAVVAWAWLIGPFRATKEEASPETAAPSEAASFTPTPQQWASMRTATVKEMEFLPQRQAEGKIAVDDHLATAVYPPYNGRVTAVFVRAGDTVKQGQPLFRLDSTDLVQAINNVVVGKAALAKAQSQLVLTKTTEDRAHQLYLAKGGSLKDWQQAQADLTAAQNDLKAAEIGLAAAQDQLRIIRIQSGETEAEALTRTTPDLNVLAPISGEVLMRKLGVGQYISQGATDPIMLIGDLSTVWLVANVRETDVPFMHVGEPVEVRVTAYPGKVFNAKITFVAPMIDVNTHRLLIRAEVPNGEGLLKPEMWADFRIATGAGRMALAVPAQAIVFEGDVQRVWVADKNHRLTSREIQTGIINGPNVEVLSGLSAGDEVITQGSIFIDRAAAGG
ncbi:MAG: efflux RND transporter periplasmic adaptor subunit [Methylocella sp.]